MLVSFIIPHKGRIDFLQQTVTSIANQETSNVKVELILVTQEPNFDESQISSLEKLEHQTLIESDEFTISKLRNIGVEVASGDLLAFIDADVDLKSDWVETLSHELISNDEYKIVSAMQICPDKPTTMEQIRVALSNAELDQFVTFLPGRNLLLRKDTFYQIGGFPENLLTCEDYYFTAKASELGKLYYTSKTHYVHIGEDKALAPMFKKEIWRAISNLRSVGGRKIPLREIPSFIVPIGIVGLLLLSIVLLLLNFKLPALGAFALGLMPALVYVFRLYSLTEKRVSLLDCLSFYLVYFLARTIGTVQGLVVNKK